MKKLIFFLSLSCMIGIMAYKSKTQDVKLEEVKTVEENEQFTYICRTIDKRIYILIHYANAIEVSCNGTTTFCKHLESTVEKEITEIAKQYDLSLKKHRYGTTALKRRVTDKYDICMLGQVISTYPIEREEFDNLIQKAQLLDMAGSD